MYRLHSRQLSTCEHQNSIMECPLSVAPYHLFRDHDHRLGREFSVAVVEQIFQGGSEEVNDENIVKAFLAEVIDIRYTS